MSVPFLKAAGGAVVEAWEELVINRGRVILSLIGVAAAVWAMGTVMALGTMMVTTFERAEVAWTGIRGTVDLGVTSGASEDNGPDIGPEDRPAVDTEGRIVNPVSTAALDLARQTKATLWSRSVETPVQIVAPGAQSCSGESPSEECVESSTLVGVDPGYFTIFGSRVVGGRLLTDADPPRRMNPVVVNLAMWNYLGRPDVAKYPRLGVRATSQPMFTVVGVIDDGNPHAEPRAFVSFDTFAAVFTPEELAESLSFQHLYVAVPPERIVPASTMLAAGLSARLGPEYRVENYVQSSEEENKEQVLATLQLIVGGIGAIVIAIGALGLLTVSIVTIRQRIREIGIRRAMGASARRIFFAVFGESVVATTLAGLVGVIASIVTVRFAPYEMVDLPDMSHAPYPMSSALVGLAIAAIVGALCGVIPATIAVRIRPIDAIRF